MSRLIELIKEVLLKHGRLARYRKILSVMMAVVVFCTTYALILPAITLDIDGALAESGLVLEEAAEESEPEVEDIPEEEDAAEEEASAEEGSADASEPEDVAAPEEEAPAEPETPADEAPAAAEVSEASEEVPAENEAPEAAVSQEETPAEQLITEPTTLIFMGEDYKVTAEFDGSARFPVGTELSVQEIRRDVKEEADAYQAYFDTALEEVQKTRANRRSLPTPVSLISAL